MWKRENRQDKIVDQVDRAINVSVTVSNEEEDLCYDKEDSEGVDKDDAFKVVGSEIVLMDPGFDTEMEKTKIKKGEKGFERRQKRRRGKNISRHWGRHWVYWWLWNHAYGFGHWVGKDKD